MANEAVNRLFKSWTVIAAVHSIAAGFVKPLMMKIR